jgi:hypothetical protein
MRFRRRSVHRLPAAALALLACAALAAPATAEPGADYPQPSSPKIVGDTPADYPQPSSPKIVGDTPADYPGMPGAPAARQPANAAPEAHQAGGFDWQSAAIGAAGGGLLIVLSLGAVSVLSHRRVRRHDAAA